MTRFLRVRAEVWLLALRDAFVSLLPLTLFGVVAVLLRHFPVPAYLSYFERVIGPDWPLFLDRAVQASHGMFGLALAVVVAAHISYRLGRLPVADDTPLPLMAGLSAMLNFMICVLYAPASGDPLGHDSMLLGIVVGIASAEVLRWSAGRRWLTIVQVPYDADRSLQQALRLCTPILFGGLLSMLANAFLRQFTLAFEPFVLFADWARTQAHGEFFATMMATLLNQLAWSVGVHGGHLLDTHAATLFAPAGNGLAWRPLFDSFVLLGGAGATLGLIVAIAWAVRDGSQRRIAVLGLFPSLFNINEVILFGLPVVLSPIYLVPFIVVPLLLAMLTLMAVHTGFIELQSVPLPWTTPALVSGWLLTGSWRGTLLQILEIALSAALYLPFVRLAEGERQRRQDKLFARCLHALQASAPGYKRVVRRQDEVGRMARMLLADLRADIGSERLRLHYQPKHDRQCALVGLEALLRWQHARYGEMPAQAVISLAEEGECIAELGDWIIAEACACKARWNAAGYRDLVMAINVSPTQLTDSGLASRTAAVLQALALNSHEIEIEVTESGAIPDEARTNATLEALAALGLRLAMDDFGMGYSSLLHLRRFAIHTIKIDGSLTRDVLSNSTNADIIRAITSLGQARHVEIVAEFVETLAQREALAEMGCAVFQGYYHSPALPESACPDYFALHALPRSA